MYKIESEEQRSGRNKETTINKSYIESCEYRRKFDKITDDKKLNRLLYNCAKEMLYHRSGTLLEDMYWIDPKECKIIANEINQTQQGKVLYSRSTKKIIKNNANLITIHSHPHSFPPSVEDFNSNNAHKYSIGIICCHNGRVYIYSSQAYIVPLYYKRKVEHFLKKGYNECEAQEKAIELLANLYDIKCKEVCV